MCYAEVSLQNLQRDAYYRFEEIEKSRLHYFKNIQTHSAAKHNEKSTEIYYD